MRGFTLIEMVTVIAITGIVAAAVSIFIRMPVQSHIDNEARAEVTDVADTALRRIGRDLRISLPNSVRVMSNGSARYLEMLLTKTGARYLSEDENPSSGNVLSFLGTSANPLIFDIVGNAPSGAQTIAAGDNIVVYNLGPGLAPADAYDCSSTCNRAQVASITNNTITLVSNPYQSQTVKMTSPYHRFQVVTGPVSYVCDPVAGTLTRYWNYTITATQSNTTAPLGTNSAVLATGVTGCDFSYNNTLGQRTGLVGLTLTLQVPGTSNGNVTLFHQVHVDNTP
jgi:MSHA biogenesis protein MshO